jgi:thioredoxin-like negative regulator of GroEL
MTAVPSDFAGELVAIIDDYRSHSNSSELRQRLQSLARSATPDAIIIAAEPYKDEPEIVAPLYEAVVEQQPNNARALVILANAYWLIGLGPDVVGELANRAIAADPANRGAWHLWALAESDPRQRVSRWQQVTTRFPGDDLALVNVADNAAAVAGAEQDYQMLDLAVASYESLLQRAELPAQRDALDTALRSLRGWRF